LYRAIDQYGQVIDVLMSEKRDLAATRRFVARALYHGSQPSAVTMDQAPAYPRVLDELVPAACHLTEQYGNDFIEADHGRLKARLQPMRGLKQLRSTRVICAGHAFVQNVRRGHYDSARMPTRKNRLTTAFTEPTSPSNCGAIAADLPIFPSTQQGRRTWASGSDSLLYTCCAAPQAVVFVANKTGGYRGLCDQWRGVLCGGERR
jgi:IS6 family transposase